jgi:hypothetical protein
MPEPTRVEHSYGRLLVLSPNITLRRKGRDEHSSLFDPVISYKKVYEYCSLAYILSTFLTFLYYSQVACLKPTLQHILMIYLLSLGITVSNVRCNGRLNRSCKRHFRLFLFPNSNAACEQYLRSIL